MDPLLKLLMFEHWVEDQMEKGEDIRDISYAVGSFINPQAVRELLNRDNNTFKSTDAEFDEFSRKLIESNQTNVVSSKKKRKRRALTGS